LHFGLACSLFFVNKLSIYSIIVDKGLICFGPRCGWDRSGAVVGGQLSAISGQTANEQQSTINDQPSI
jgi:hypothetical protein